MPLDIPTERKELLALIDRRHPAYKARLAHWGFCRATYDGGRDWFRANIFKYVKEGPKEFEDRLLRTYRFNHTREVVNLVTKYIFKSGVIRNHEEAPAQLRAFWRHATVQGISIDEFMSGVCNLSSIYGRVWVVTDSMVPPNTRTRADELTARGRIYAYTVTPEDALDYAYDRSGRLLWFMYRFAHRDDGDPVTSKGGITTRYMILTREEWVMLEETVKGHNQREVRLVERGENALGEVPVFCVDDRVSDDPYDVPALIGDIAYLDRAIANYLSNLDAIIQDQTFSQLVIPSQGLMPGEEAHGKLVEMGTKRIFVYDAESSHRGPEYISPDASQAEVILKVVNKIIAEIYHSVGMAGERTKQDNAVGIDNSSGVAKAYDFERVNSLLASKAAVLDRAENDLARLVCGWAGVKPPRDAEGQDKDLIKYPESFDVRSLYDEFEVAENLTLLDAPSASRREQMRTLLAKLFPRLSESKLAEIEKDLANWPRDPADGLTQGSLSSSQRGSGDVVGNLRRNQATPGLAEPEPRQGQVTDETPN
jgi:hypothetical protein